MIACLFGFNITPKHQHTRKCQLFRSHTHLTVHFLWGVCRVHSLGCAPHRCTLAPYEYIIPVGVYFSILKTFRASLLLIFLGPYSEYIYRRDSRRFGPEWCLRLNLFDIPFCHYLHTLFSVLGLKLGKACSVVRKDACFYFTGPKMTLDLVSPGTRYFPRSDIKY